MKRIAVGLGLIVVAVLSASVTFAATGGPDGGGYTFINNVGEPTGPLFSFVNLTGGDIGSSCDDCVISGVPIGFTFNFYGAPQTSMNISSNGNIQFGTTVTQFGNASLPTAALGRAIAPWWDDLRTDCSTTDSIFVQTFGSAPTRATVIMWRMTPHFNPGCLAGDLTFEAILFEGTDHILFQYLDTFIATGLPENNGGSATVGIQRDPNTALQYSFNSPVITPGLAVCFRPPTSANVSPCIVQLGPPVPTATAVVTPTVTPTVIATPKVAARPPQLGAFLGPTSGSERNLANAGIAVPGGPTPRAAVAAAAPAAAAPVTVVRPPSTGDAGLRARHAALPVELALLLPLTLLYVGALRAVRVRDKR